jgi:predicted DNA-binding ribbon-helix-helix protein
VKPKNLLDACLNQLRVLQYKGKKTAVRLEAIFWSQIKEFAAEDEVTISQLVAAVTEANAEQPNKTALLRCYCLDRLRTRLSAEKLQAESFDMLAVIAACPTPVAVITPERRLAAFNPPFSQIVSSLRESSEDGRALQLTFNEPVPAIQRHLIEQPMRIRSYQIGVRIGDSKARYFPARFALASRDKGPESLLIAFLDDAVRQASG